MALELPAAPAHVAPVVPSHLLLPCDAPWAPPAAKRRALAPPGAGGAWTEPAPLAGLPAGRRPPPPLAWISAGGAPYFPSRPSPTGSAASDEACTSTGALPLGAGSGAAKRPRLSIGSQCALPPPLASAGPVSPPSRAASVDGAADTEAALGLLAEPSSAGGPDLLEKMRIAHELLTHRDRLQPSQLQCVLRHLQALCAAASVDQLMTPHAQHDARGMDAASPTGSGGSDSAATGHRRGSATGMGPAGEGAAPRPTPSCEREQEREQERRVSGSGAETEAARRRSSGAGRGPGSPSSSSSSSHTAQRGGDPRPTTSTLSGPPPSRRQGPASAAGGAVEHACPPPHFAPNRPPPHHYRPPQYPHPLAPPYPHALPHPIPAPRLPRRGLSWSHSRESLEVNNAAGLPAQRSPSITQPAASDPKPADSTGGAPSSAPPMPRPLAMPRSLPRPALVPRQPLPGPRGEAAAAEGGASSAAALLAALAQHVRSRPTQGGLRQMPPAPFPAGPDGALAAPPAGGRAKRPAAPFPPAPELAAVGVHPSLMAGGRMNAPRLVPGWAGGPPPYGVHPRAVPYGAARGQHGVLNAAPDPYVTLRLAEHKAPGSKAPAAGKGR
ncbi:hypothetical protein HYH03_009118 [Edaphochlamys debaryana]|uniref:Uncharacterized protein n=1 Tax=Edaphochlamys debaryana TaxID=47281 RepID=A0A835XZ79_9CHLO|nr:hypothetical protein HYH03_009118 [Edaphochlamys debaryana]|eukprot:KAG2492705.1 hypothetical protein HYH03_009118 [Edaphochlamys debaryana]